MMASSLQKILESKRALRRELAALPIAEKFRMLEAMRDRAMALRRRGEARQPSRIRAK
jgi:hypothetical protein